MRSALGMAVVVSILAGRAHAQPSDSTAVADQLFKQGRDLAKENRWAEACPKFEASLRYDPALGTRLNLATCYERVDKLASAWGLYRAAIDLAEKDGDLKRRDYARTQAAALEPRLPRLTISTPARRPPEFVVTRGDATVDAAALGVALYVDAGTHQITASAPGYRAFTQSVTLIDGHAETVTIPELTALPVARSAPELPRSPAADRPASPGPAATPSPRARSADPTGPAVAPSSSRRYLALGAGAAGVVMSGVGLWFGARASSTYSDAKALCGPDLICVGDNVGKGKQLISDARSSATVSTVLVAAGAAALVAGAVLYLTAPHRPEQPVARIVPVAHDRGAGVAVLGRF